MRLTEFAKSQAKRIKKFENYWIALAAIGLCVGFWFGVIKLVIYVLN